MPFEKPCEIAVTFWSVNFTGLEKCKTDYEVNQLYYVVIWETCVSWECFEDYNKASQIKKKTCCDALVTNTSQRIITLRLKKVTLYLHSIS